MKLTALLSLYDKAINALKNLDFVVPVAFRLILAPVMIVAGYNKLQLSKLGDEGVSFLTALSPDPSVVSWFGNPDWGLGMPAPELMATLAGWTEFAGGWMILIGLGVRFFAIPLAITMLVAALTAHADNGWFAIAPGNASTSAALAYDWLGFEAAKESLANSEEISQRLGAAKSILREHGNYGWLTGKGNFAILNNGMEFAITYFFMFLTLFFMGAGRFFSVDWWIRTFVSKSAE